MSLVGSVAFTRRAVSISFLPSASTEPFEARGAVSVELLAATRGTPVVWTGRDAT